MINAIPNEREAYKLLLLSMLTYNGYYENIRAWAKAKNYGLEKVAAMLTLVRGQIPDGMSAYYFLDSIEDALSKLDGDKREQFDNGYDFIDYLYDNSLWKE